MEFLDKQVYYISQLPSELRWGDVTLVTGISFVLALLATLYPELAGGAGESGGGIAL